MANSLVIMSALIFGTPFWQSAVQVQLLVFLRPLVCRLYLQFMHKHLSCIIIACCLLAFVALFHDQLVAAYCGLLACN